MLAVIMKKHFSKSRIIFILWILFGIVLLVLILKIEGSSLQGTMGKIAILYIGGSWIISGVIRRMVGKEKNNNTDSDQMI